MATRLYDIDPGPDCPEIVRMIVEIPKNSSNKYEYDGELGVFRLDRALYSPHALSRATTASFPARWPKMAIRWTC